jgi:TonB family protein
MIPMTSLASFSASLSAKIALLGGIAWLQLWFLRRAPASSRSRLCSLSLIAILLLASGEILSPAWTIRTPVPAALYNFAVTSVPTPSPVIHATPGSWLMFAWIVGAAVLLSRAIAGRTALVILRRRSTPLESVEGIDVRFAAVQTPILVGLARPAILLPEAARRWTGEQRRMVLKHELTHYRQGDCWTNLIAQLLRAVFWFHPVVWMLVARLSREQELTCDEAVVASGHSPHDYAAFLLDTVRHLKSGEVFACAMAGSGARSLQQRFANLLKPGPRPRPTRRIVVSLVLFVLAAAVLTVIRPAWLPRAVLAQGTVLADKPTVLQRAPIVLSSPNGDHRQRADSEEPYQGGVYKVGGDVTQPVLLTKVEPQYTEAARAAKIAGPVRVTLIVTPEGKPDSIEVTDGIGFGLDQSAIDAISQWAFQPATKDGSPVAVRATVEVNFRLL